jgi:hypothetical protein
VSKLYAGLDVSDRLTHICIVEGDGAIVWRGACATDPDVLAKTLDRHAPELTRVVLERHADLTLTRFYNTGDHRAGGTAIHAARHWAALEGSWTPAFAGELKGLSPGS